MRRQNLWFSVNLATLGMLVALGTPAPGVPANGADTKAKTRRAIDRGLAYLAAGQDGDGGWEAFGKPHPAITALVVKAFLQDKNYGPGHRVPQRGIEFLLRYVQPDGGIYDDGEGMRNYHTSVALMALAAARNTAHDETIKRAQEFLKRLQWDDGEGHEASSAWHGGQGYGKQKRPDLSNTQLMLDALKDSGLPADDPAYKKAMIFVSRSQMLSETNDQPFARGSEDGGFIYTPANGGESKAGTEIVEGKPRLRSYGSMTYAGFKSMLYAELDRKDVRVQKAWGWIQRHYTLERNPNMPDDQAHQGLYYYYHTFARALHAWGEESIVDSRGAVHFWRTELCDKLMSLQHDNGSWSNEADRWYEDNPHLVTAYAILALQTALMN